MEASGLTEKQGEVLRYIDMYVKKHGGRVPTLAEIATGAGVYSASNVRGVLRGLEERGYIRRLPNRARAIEIIRMP